MSSSLCLYLSPSHSPCLRLSVSICIYSLQSVFSPVEPPFLHSSLAVFISHSSPPSCSSFPANHVFLFCSYILLHPPPPPMPWVRLMGFKTLKKGTVCLEGVLREASSLLSTSLTFYCPLLSLSPVTLLSSLTPTSPSQGIGICLCLTLKWIWLCWRNRGGWLWDAGWVSQSEF